MLPFPIGTEEEGSQEMADRAAAAGVRPSTLAALPRTALFRLADTSLSHTSLRRLTQAGVIEKVGHGLYRRLDAPLIDLDLAEVALRSTKATVCLLSALAHHDLVTAIPTRHDIALPRGHGTITTPVPVAWHFFDAATFDVGRTELLLGDEREDENAQELLREPPPDTTYGGDVTHVGNDTYDRGPLRIGLYNPERSIADAFRLRHQIGHEIAVEALRTWLRRPGASPATLVRTAEQLPHARRPLTDALAVLL